MDMDAVEPTEQVEISELEPTEQATNVEPTSEMMLEATPEPTSAPTEAPIPNPTPEPTSVPTEPPTPVLTPEPTPVPTEPPTPVPTPDPTPEPEPTPVPTEPTSAPTEPSTPVSTPELTPEPEPIPEPTEEAQVPMPSEGYTQVAAFRLMACGLRVDQAVDCWGSGITPDFAPSEGIFTGLKRVSQGVCGVRVDGSIGCFGAPEFLSESGLYDVNLAEVPFDTWETSTEKAFTCGIRSDNSAIECWPEQETHPDYKHLFVDAYVGPPGQFVDVAVASQAVCGLRADGSVVCNTWGYWDGFYEEPFLGMPMSSIFGGSDIVCGIRVDFNALECVTGGWAAERGIDEWSPAPVVEVSAGDEHLCALRTDAAIECWGVNRYGQTDAPEGAFVSVAAAQWDSCGVRITGEVECWGRSIAESLRQAKLGDMTYFRSGSG